MAYNVQGFAQVGNSTPRLPEPSAECRIKKLIICSFAHIIRSARTADDSSTNADVYSVCPSCAKPNVACSLVNFKCPKPIKLSLDFRFTFHFYKVIKQS